MNEDQIQANPVSEKIEQLLDVLANSEKMRTDVEQPVHSHPENVQILTSEILALRALTKKFKENPLS